MIKKLGKFGALVKEYEKARRSYPSEVLKFFKNKVAVRSPLVLDIGCGTGISTRQLARLGIVIGCDPDLHMLNAAKKYASIKQEKYVLGAAEHLPFKNSTFDAVTAFGAFHWFNNKRSIAEIKRVLRPGGKFFVVNKNGAKRWGEGYRNAIIKTINREIAHFQKNSYNPKQSLIKNGFKKIQARLWKENEIYTLKNALEYVQSVSIWNSVPISLRKRALVGLEEYFKKMKRSKGRIERKLEVRVIVGTK